MSYNQSQSRGLIYLIVALAVWQIIFLIYRWKLHGNESEPDQKWRLQMLSYFENTATDSLFVFDPNSASREEWVALGLSPRQAQVAVSFLSKAPISKREQLQQLFVIDSAFYQKVAPFIRLKSGKLEQIKKAWEVNSVTAPELMELGLSESTAVRYVAFREKIGGFKTMSEVSKVFGVSKAWLEDQAAFIADLNDTTTKDSLAAQLDQSFFEEVQPTIKYDINRLDSVGWIGFRGIGPVFASRIISYREKLGGFAEPWQLLEVYGMDTARLTPFFDQLFVEEGALIQMNINEDSELDLRSHPYINWDLAREIVQFRNSYRTFKSIDELMNLNFMDPDLFLKIAPYLKTEN